ncbi:MAG: tetratricopeptide repeat protein [Bryobacterales bacterium]|nr:tetratricopeptide repeat protein [Bryobacterales bacterium]
MRFRTILVAFLVLGSGLRAAEPDQLDGSLTLFSVMAALNAAGFDAEAGSPSNHPLRTVVRNALAAKDIPILPELRRYVREHRQETDTATLSLYISFSLCVEAPSFKYRYRLNDLPPEVAALSGLPDLLKKFHQEAGIDTLWKLAQPALNQALEVYHAGVSRAVLEANGYLRNPTSGSLGQHFQIYLDLLAPPNQVHVRSYGVDFFVVATNSHEPQIDDIRHAYLQYLVGPLVLRRHELIEKKKGLGDFAGPAPLLPDMYKKDFLLLTEASLVKAIEARLATGPGSGVKRKEMVDRAMAEGYILTPYFSEALLKYEKQDQSMRFYFPDLIEGIDLKKEDKRLEGVQFATAPVARKVKLPPPAPPKEVSKAERTLREAEDLLASKQLAESRVKFLAVLQASDDKAVHAKAYYGLARIAIRGNDPELGERLLKKTLELGPESADKCWSLVYLGRLADIGGEAGQAAKYYQAALAVEGGSEKGRETAERGLKGEFRPGRAGNK